MGGKKRPKSPIYKIFDQQNIKNAVFAMIFLSNSLLFNLPNTIKLLFLTRFYIFMTKMSSKICLQNFIINNIIFQDICIQLPNNIQISLIFVWIAEGEWRTEPIVSKPSLHPHITNISYLI